MCRDQRDVESLQNCHIRCIADNNARPKASAIETLGASAKSIITIRTFSKLIVCFRGPCSRRLGSKPRALHASYRNRGELGSTEIPATRPFSNPCEFSLSFSRPVEKSLDHHARSTASVWRHLHFDSQRFSCLGSAIPFASLLAQLF